jgi:predicted type IV restriction endonuclease
VVRRRIRQDGGMDTIIAWLVAIVAFGAFWVLVVQRRGGPSARDRRLIIVAIVACVALGAVLDAVL